MLSADREAKSNESTMCIEEVVRFIVKGHDYLIQILFLFCLLIRRRTTLHRVQ